MVAEQFCNRRFFLFSPDSVVIQIKEIRLDIVGIGLYVSAVELGNSRLSLLKFLERPLDNVQSIFVFGDKEVKPFFDLLVRVGVSTLFQQRTDSKFNWQFGNVRVVYQFDSARPERGFPIRIV